MQRKFVMKRNALLNLINNTVMTHCPALPLCKSCDRLMSIHDKEMKIKNAKKGGHPIYTTVRHMEEAKLIIEMLIY